MGNAEFLDDRYVYNKLLDNGVFKIYSAYCELIKRILEFKIDNCIKIPYTQIWYYTQVKYKNEEKKEKKERRLFRIAR